VNPIERKKTMTIQDKQVVSFHYTLSNQDGEQMETTRNKEPMTYLHGAQNIIPGLENAMAGRSVGDEFQVTLEPADAYGEKKEANIQRISSKHFRFPKKLKPGQIVGLQTRKGPVQVTIVKVGRFNVDVDSNHPLAGQALIFDVEISAVRDATEEEMSHGHAHGLGGVDH
jgi:FKBP-type peptidyl-prolyl cis-trans isomerase SlyD